MTVKTPLWPPMASLEEVDRACGETANFVLLVWVLVVVVVLYNSTQSRWSLFEPEREAAGFAGCALSASVTHRLIKSSMSRLNSKDVRHDSGIVRAAIVVNFVAASANWIIYFVDPPLLVDHITGCRVHLVRWCEWSLLSFLMTFIVDSIDTSAECFNRFSTRGALTLAAAQGLSASCGLIFPLLSPSLIAWSSTMVVCFLLFFSIIPRFYEKKKRISEVRAKVTSLLVALGATPSPFSSPVLSFDDAVDLERMELGMFLFHSVAVFWSLLICSYFIEWSITSFVTSRSCTFDEKPSIWASLPFMINCLVDVAAKLVYNCVIVDAYSQLYAIHQNAMVSKHKFKQIQDHEQDKLTAVRKTAREMDTKANQFSRHEVKNGLLTAIALCENLFDQLCADAPSGSNEPKLAVLSELNGTLFEMLNVVVMEAMVRDLFHDAHVSKPEVVDVDTLLRSSLSKTATASSRFKFEVSLPLPPIVVDVNLLTCFYRKAIANACHHGETGGEVTTRLTYNETQAMQLQVVNKPGLNHEALIALPPHEASAAVFSRRVPDGSKGAQTVGVDGNGGWVLLKCASALGGQVDIAFEQDLTVLTLKFPAPRASAHGVASPTSQGKSNDYTGWKLPENVWGLGVDDSGMQRKLLRKMFQYLGIPEDRIIIKGSTDDECLEFAEEARKVVLSHPEDYHLVIADEYLDFKAGHAAGGGKRVTLSGSEILKTLLNSLRASGHEGSVGDDTCAENQVLALVRSANDGGEDIALYNERAHGFIPKEPLRKSRVFEVVGPLWLSRFGGEESVCTSRFLGPKMSSTESQDLDLALSSSSSSIGSFESLTDASDFFEASAPESRTADDEVQVKKESIATLRRLKGDLMCFGAQPNDRTALALIDAALSVDAEQLTFESLSACLRDVKEAAGRLHGE